jgi:hypothetical protein
LSRELLGRFPALGKDAPHRPSLAQVPGEPTGVDPFEHGNARSPKPVIQALGRTPVGEMARKLPHHYPADLRMLRLGILGIDSVIADHRRGHHHDLTQVARISERFLVAGVVGGEHHLTECRIDGSRRAPREPGAILEQDESGAVDRRRHCLG